MYQYKISTQTNKKKQSSSSSIIKSCNFLHHTILFTLQFPLCKTKNSCIRSSNFSFRNGRRRRRWWPETELQFR
ncbi:hypothetical protein QVD17_03162 [Tagetes erecta]|uniref:Uncharacterized protein n=1 Tax=Tagetes erecta TaxID=13708 RepID=A0AAD8P9S7_TARER|nr:hypothetical protein QVD17_03162 [Tagetes erecta]